MNRCKITSQITNIDCIDGMKQLDNNSIDGIITDPPYGLGFMGKEWDTFDKNQFGKKGNEGKNDLKVKKDFKMVPWYKTDGLYDFTKVWATEGLRVLKPGGHLLSFAGSRTYHKIACAIEDVGFEIRDQIMWIYGSGFPKSLNIEKQLAKNSISEEAKQWEGWGTALKPAHEPIVVARKPLSEKNVALNVLKWGTAGINIDECRIETDEDTKRNQKGNHNSTSYSITKNGLTGGNPFGRFPANLIHDGIQKEWSRYFYCAKASKKERNEGLEGFEVKNKHPTVKPIALMRYLIRLVTPPGGIVLDPFVGSGTTGISAYFEQKNFIGFEKEQEYVDIAQARMNYYKKQKQWRKKHEKKKY